MIFKKPGLHWEVVFTFVSILLPLYAAGALAVPPDSVIEKKNYTTQQLKGTSPGIDGFLNETVWDQVEWGGDFIQFMPYEGKEPSQKTAFKILYDDKNLYVGIKCYDKEPDKIVKRMARRDYFDGDWVEIQLDSYFDHLTAFSFNVNATGVKGDEYITKNGENWDDSWDPIWYVKTSIDSQGWVAEMRIPLSQLRFSDQDNQVWGLEFMRRDFRMGERSVWHLIPKNAPGWVHLFGELQGLKGLKPQKQVEIMPYVLGKAERFKKEEGNPYADGSRNSFNAGIDGKIGITNNFILDFTVNPDFGQVEADPSVVNLTGFQNYFSERRPFFMEGNNILDYQVSPSIAWGDHNNDNLFYSRRIGHSPQLSPVLGVNEFADIPENTSILGALKLTGKTRQGLSVGVMESVTQKEVARISDGTNERTEVVEPLSNYFETRVIKDYNKGNTQVGGIITAVNRRIKDPEADLLHTGAYTGGLDFVHNWKNRTWYISGNMLFSNIQGSSASITHTQTSQEHLFQRPGISHVQVDSTLTSLNGTGGTLKFGKGGNGHIQFQVGGTYRSPGLELNDIGFMRKSDAIYQFFWMGYQLRNPWKIFRRFNNNINQWTDWDFSGANLYRAANNNMHMQFKNYYSTGGGITHTFYQMSNDMLRGGAPLLLPGKTNYWVYAASDDRKKFIFQIYYELTSGQDNYLRQENLNLWLKYQPLNYLSISLSPGISNNWNSLQYVTDLTYNSDLRYIVGYISQSTASLTARVNFSITPNLSVQYYGQPFVSKGIYSDFKRITNPKAGEYKDRFHQFTANEISFDPPTNTYNVDENGDGTKDYSFSNPDFDFMQYRSNMVVRWEYIPGSTIFFVWSQSKTGGELLDDHSFNNQVNTLYEIKPYNVFLLKLSYRFIK